MMQVVSTANQLIVWIIEGAATVALYGLIFFIVAATLWRILQALIVVVCRTCSRKKLKHRKGRK